MRGIARRHLPRSGDVESHERALHDDYADGEHGELQTEGQPLTEVRGVFALDTAEIFLVQAQFGVFGESVHEARHGAEPLSEHGCCRRADDSPAERHDEQQVEGDIEHGGNEKEQQRSGGVAYAAQDGAHEIVEHLREDTAENDEAIVVRGAVNLAVCGRQVDDAEHSGKNRDGKSGEYSRDDCGQHYLRGERAAHARRVSVADAVGSDDAEARGATESELQEDVGEGENIVDARHFVGGKCLSADDCVADRVYLLQEIGQHYGQRKTEQNFPLLALAEIDRSEIRFDFCRKSVHISSCHRYFIYRARRSQRHYVSYIAVSVA